MRFSSTLRWIFYVTLTLMFISGVSWWYFENFVHIQTALGEDHHPLQALFLKIHGSLSYGLMLILGYLVSSHIVPGLRQKRSRYSGFTLMAWLSVLILTAIYQLYGPEGGVRDFLTGTHRWVGLLIPVAILSHLYWGRKRRRKKNIL